MIALALTLDTFGAPGLLADVASGRVPSLWATLALGYLGVGTAMAWHLARRGHSLGTATSALACWPLLLGLVGRAAPAREVEFDLSRPVPARALGPYGARIDGCVLALRQALREALHEDPVRATALISAEQLDKLGAALHRADLRLARVDRLLDETEAQRPWIERPSGGQARARAQPNPALGEAITHLRLARDHSRAELEAVLSGLLQLRVQLGLFALAGDAEPVRERLTEIEARVAALAELSSIDLDGAPP